MPAAVRGRGLLVAVGFPTAAVFVLAMWLALQGGADMTVLPAAAVLVVLAGLAEQITIVVTPRIHISVAFGFVVAAALIGGPLVGACAGASAPLLEKGAVWRKRVAWGGADALSGFAIGILGQQVVLPGGAGALALAAVALLTGLLLNSLNMGIVALDRSGAWWPEFSRSWPSHLLAAALPWAPLAAFLFTYHLAPSVALALACGLLLALWLGNRVRLRLEQRLAEERLRARLDALAELAERVRRLVADQPFPVAGQLLPVTCSVGAARLDEFRGPKASLEAASRLVRAAKQRRNAVEVETNAPPTTSRAGSALEATTG